MTTPPGKGGRTNLGKRCGAKGCGTTWKGGGRACPRCGSRRYRYGFEAVIAGRRHKRFTFPTERAAAEALAELRSAHAQGTHVERSNATVGEYLADWLASVRGEYAPGTLDTATLHVERYITPRLGTVRLQSLTGVQVKGFLADLRSSGRLRGDGPLSEKSVHNVYRTLSRALNDAVADRLIPRNPAARAHKAPASPPQATWSAGQLRAFLAHCAANRDRWLPLWMLAADSGMRRGELAGLRWADLDLDAGRVHLSEQRAKGAGAVQRRVLKGKRGRRIDGLAPETVAALRGWRRQQAAERLAWPGDWGNDEDLVFTSADGSPLHPDSITKLLKRRVRAAGLPWVRLHGLRHGWASLALQSGTHPKVVQERLGHSSIAITLDVYSHLQPGMQAEAAAKVGGLIYGPEGDRDAEAEGSAQQGS